LSPDYVRPTGRPPGFKPVHLLFGAVLGVAWLVLTVVVLTRGHGDQSSVDVYSQLPPAFTNELAAKGVLYQGLSPVDSGTVDRVLAQVPLEGGATASRSPIVLRTSFSDSAKGITDRPALMVVVPTTGGTGGSAVSVTFVDPTTYETLTTLSYATSGGSG
jgi:hypothetical protein